MCRAVRIILCRTDQETLDRILPSVALESLILEGVSHSPIQKTWLPDFPLHLQTLIQPKRKPALYKLHGAFQGDSRGRQDQVKMIRHHNKFVQKVLFLHSVVQQDFNEEARDLVNLKEASLLKTFAAAK